MILHDIYVPCWCDNVLFTPHFPAGHCCNFSRTASNRWKPKRHHYLLRGAFVQKKVCIGGGSASTVSEVVQEKRPKVVYFGLSLGLSSDATSGKPPKTLRPFEAQAPQQQHYTSTTTWSTVATAANRYNCKRQARVCVSCDTTGVKYIGCGMA